MRLIDADKVGVGMADTWQKVMVKCEVDSAETINPEDFPIVQHLREVAEARGRLLEKTKKQLLKVAAQRDAAIKELGEVACAVDELSDLIDSEVHPVCDYNLYLMLRENVDAISIWNHETEWRPIKEE